MFIKRFNEIRILAACSKPTRFHARQLPLIAQRTRIHPDKLDFVSERTMKTLRIFAISLAAVLALPFLARGQDTGYITGTVTDKSSAAIAEAQVTVANEARGIHQTVPTNSSGDYLVAGLPAATYTVSVTAKGFESFQESGIVLAAAEKRRVDVQLTVGAVSEHVTVEGDSAPAVETESSEVSDTITAKQVTQLELNGRNFTQLVTLAPGVSDQSQQDEGVVGVFGNVSYSINGGRTEYNNWEIDGIGDMDDGSATSLNVYPNADAIQEFQVLTSNYGAQYGKNGSGTGEAGTKPGGGRWKSGPSPARKVFTVTFFISAAMISSTLEVSSIQTVRHTKNMISATPLAALFTSRTITIQISRKHSSFSRKSGAAKKIRPPSFRTFPLTRSAPAIFQICVPTRPALSQIAPQFPVQAACSIRVIKFPLTRRIRTRCWP